MLASAVLFAGCENLPSAPAIEPQRGIQAMICEMNPDCTPSGDPDPTGAGYYYPTLTWEYCTDEFINDVDHDGLDDSCEQAFAQKFAPLLSTDPADQDLTREPHWAAALELTGRVKIMYMLGYYRDNGTEDVCPEFDPDKCLPHAGDSEFIYVEIEYNWANSHWSLVETTLSAHWGDIGNSSERVFANNLEFPAKYGGYPRVYVAVDKHANYKSRSACNDGAILWADDCTNTVDNSRVFVGGYRNIGSNSGRIIDQSTSSRPGYTGVEYFWSATYFCGWQPSSRCAGPYRRALDAFTF